MLTKVARNTILAVFIRCLAGALALVCGVAGALPLSVAAATAVAVTEVPPTIVTPPLSLTVINGKTATFTVSATGTPGGAALTYQWYFNDVAVSGPAGRRATYSFVAIPARAGSYHVEVTNPALTVTSEPVTLNVLVRPVFTTQPKGFTLDAGQPLALVAAASGTPSPEFQWFHDNVEIPGAASATFSLDSVDALDTGLYKVRATNAAGVVFSRAVSVVVRSAPLIVSSPEDQEARVGTPLRLSVIACGVPGRSYQWRLNGEPIAGARAANFVLKPALAKSGVYDVVVGNALGSVLSDPFTITVTDTPRVTTAPVAARRREGQAYTLSVVATGFPEVSYQWTKDGVAIEGATSASLAFDKLTLDDEADYAVRVTNALGVTTTKPVKLQVSRAPYSALSTASFRLNGSVSFIDDSSAVINERHNFPSGKVTILDFTDNSTNQVSATFSRVDPTQTRLKFNVMIDGVRAYFTYNYFFTSTKAGTFTVSVYAKDYGTVATGSGTFTYAEPGL